MGKRVVLTIEEGSFEQGFPISVRIFATRQRALGREVRGRFPPAPHIPHDYQNWQEVYRRLGGIQRITVPPSQVTNVSTLEECRVAADRLASHLNEWLNQPVVRSLERQLLREIGEPASLQFILQTRNPDLRRLPWHVWSFFRECYPQAEVTLCAETEPYSRRFNRPVRILALVGSQQPNESLLFATDLTVLEQLPHAQVECLESHQRSLLYDRLWEQTKAWDILFFSGHSVSYTEDRGGAILLGEPLSLERLHNALEHAVQRGLKLAIFNSCDGLGLAQYLADLKIPCMIVMREPIPDVVAQRFAQYFLTSFAQGQALPVAVQTARRRLQEELEPAYPCASWLPVVFQNPLACELTYPRPAHWGRVTGWVAGTAIIAMLAGFLSDDLRQRQRLSMGERILVPAAPTPEKIAAARAYWWGNEAAAIAQWERSLQRQRNDPEARIYLNNARVGDRPAYKIAVPVPIGSNPNVAQEILRGVAQAQSEINQTAGPAATRLKVVIANDDNHPQTATRLAERFVADPTILAVMGHNASDASVATASTYNQKGLVMITPTSFSDKLSSSGKYTFRMVPSIWFIADKLTDHIIQTTPQAKVAICSDSAAVDNESYRNQFTNALQKKGGTFINVPCDFADAAFDPERAMADILAQGANGLLLAPHIDRIHRAVEMARANRGRLPLYGSPTLYTSATLSGRAAVNGLVLPAPWHQATFANHPFSQRATRLWGGQVNWRSAMAYDAVWAIVNSLKPKPTRTGLSDALHRPTFLLQGATGKVQFLPSGDRQIGAGIGVLVQIQVAPQAAIGYEFRPLSLSKRP